MSRRAERVYHVVSVLLIVAMGVAGGFISNSSWMYLATIGSLVLMHFLEVVLGERKEEDVARKLSSIVDLVNSFASNVEKTIKNCSDEVDVLYSMLMSSVTEARVLAESISRTLGGALCGNKLVDKSGEGGEKGGVNSNYWEYPLDEGPNRVEEKG